MRFPYKVRVNGEEKPTAQFHLLSDAQLFKSAVERCGMTALISDKNSTYE